MNLYEKKLQNAVMMRVGRHKDIRIWRHNVGRARPLSNPDTVVQYGRAGQSDIMGVLRVTPTLGLFLSIEVKSWDTRTSPEQKSWAAMVRDFGGLHYECRLFKVEGLIEDAIAATVDELLDKITRELQVRRRM